MRNYLKISQLLQSTIPSRTVKMGTTKNAVTLVLVLLATVQSKEYTDEDIPHNLTLLEVVDRHAHISWEPVSRLSSRNCYPRYLVNVWSEDGNDTFRILPEITSTKVPYFPGVLNNVTVSVSRCNSVGPPSNVLSFQAPDAEPQKPEYLNVHQLGNDSVMVTWYQPRERTGKLLGYHLYYGDLSKQFSMENSNHCEVLDVDHEQAKLSDLTEEATYKVGVYAINTAGSSTINYKEFRLQSLPPRKPGKPTFTWMLDYTRQEIEEHTLHTELYETTPSSAVHLIKVSTTVQPKAPISLADIARTDKSRCTTSLKIVWHPNFDDHPGDYFKAKMKTAEEEEYNTVWTQYSEDYVLTNSYDACKKHHIIVTSVDGEFETDSDVQEIEVVRD